MTICPICQYVASVILSIMFNVHSLMLIYNQPIMGELTIKAPVNNGHNYNGSLEEAKDIIGMVDS